MFDGLTERLSGVFERLGGRGVLSEKDIDEALREVRVALLEADVALPVVKDFISKAKELAGGEAVIRSVKPADQVVKIVYDGLVDMLGGDVPTGLNLALNPPSIILMAGLQGSGKTTTTGKLALRLSKTERKKVLVASLDTRRPAAMEQLALLATQVGVESLPIVAGQSAVDIAKRAVSAAKLGGYDVLILDTAGRTTLDEAMMNEAAEVARIANPSETILVADSLTGQDAVRTAKAFHERLPLTGLILTRADGDGRGGAALSMRHVTGLPIKFLGAGEKIDQLDVFDARRVAGRILGQGDVVALVEKAAETIDAEKAAAMAQKMAKGKFDLDDLAAQLRQMQKLGGMEGIMGLLPGVQKVKKQIAESGVETADAPLIRTVVETARQITATFEAAIDRGEIALADLMDENYREIPGTNPKQYMTRYVEFTDRVLPAIQDPIQGSDPRIVFCVAWARGGYLPTHNPNYRKPQGPDPVWNNANCRNRRLFEDRAVKKIAAASNKPFLLQTYRRDMGGGQFVLMKDLSAPIVIKGRHWGAFRMGFRLQA